MLKKPVLIPIILCIAAVVIVLMVLGKWNILVWGLFLLCPLMHLFGHNHSGHNHSNRSKHHH